MGTEIDKFTDLESSLLTQLKTLSLNMLLINSYGKII